MNRLTRVVEHNNHSVVLELVQAEKCAGCPAHCNEPLIQLFALKNNRFELNKSNKYFDIEDQHNLFSKNDLTGQMLTLNIPSHSVMLSSGMLYLLPLLSVMLLIVLGHYLGYVGGLNTDLTALVGLFFGLYVSYVLTQKTTKKHLKIRPKVTILPVRGT